MTPFNPLVRFQKAMIPGLLRMGNIYLVSQTYNRGQNAFDDTIQPLLLTDYDRLDAAKDHLQALSNDKWAAIIHLDNQTHRAKLEEMAGSDGRYLLYAAFVKDVKQVNVRNNKYLSEAVRQYINKHTSWTPGGGDTIRPVLELKFGELFLRIGYSGQVVKEKLTIFENIISTACVTTYPLRPVSEQFRITFQNSLPIPK